MNKLDNHTHAILESIYLEFGQKLLDIERIKRRAYQLMIQAEQPIPQELMRYIHPNVEFMNCSNWRNSGINS